MDTKWTWLYVALTFSNLACFSLTSKTWLAWEQQFSILHFIFPCFLQEEEAKQLVCKAIRAGIFNDLGSGSNVDVCVIKKDKVDYIRPFDEANLKGKRWWHFNIVAVFPTVPCVCTLPPILDYLSLHLRAEPRTGLCVLVRPFISIERLQLSSLVEMCEIDDFLLFAGKASTRTRREPPVCWPRKWRRLNSMWSASQPGKWKPWTRRSERCPPNNYLCKTVAFWRTWSTSLNSRKFVSV